MSTITNEFMIQMLGKAKNYTVVILKKGPNDVSPERKAGYFQLFARL